MAKYCDSCRQGYPDDHDSCPHCAGRPAAGAHLAAVNGVLKDGRPAAEEAPCVSDPEIDLGSPVTSAQSSPTAGPPSGASLVSWAELLPPKGLTPADGSEVRYDPQSDPKFSPPKPPAPAADGADDAEIDLDQPVKTPDPNAGPPSGASFTSWTTLLPERKPTLPTREERVDVGTPLPGGRVPVFPAGPSRSAEDSRTIRTARDLMVPTPDAPPPAPAARKIAPWVGGVLIGIVLAVAACLALWAAGFEPPPGWRHQPPSVPAEPRGAQSPE